MYVENDPNFAAPSAISRCAHLGDLFILISVLRALAAFFAFRMTNLENQVERIGIHLLTRWNGKTSSWGDRITVSAMAVICFSMITKAPISLTTANSSAVLFCTLVEGQGEFG